ncbi:hypothetical protein EPO15_14335 [bacterium]|nr:MAG: hypothetical protein EPO15_14335 [bacterium]
MGPKSLLEILKDRLGAEMFAQVQAAANTKPEFSLGKVPTLRPEKVALDRGLIAKEEFLELLSKEWRCPIADLRGVSLGKQELGLFSPYYHRHFVVLPLAIEGNTLPMAMADPHSFDDFLLVTDLHAHKGLKIQPRVALAQEIHEAIDVIFGERLGGV